MRWASCEGWWEQDGFGRQMMEDLRLSFDNGEVTGLGRDAIGEFSLSGIVENEKVFLRKQYLGQHAVEYPGVFDGEGTLCGIWHIGGFGGRWLIRVGQCESTCEIQEFRP